MQTLFSIFPYNTFIGMLRFFSPAVKMLLSVQYQPSYT